MTENKVDPETGEVTGLKYTHQLARGTANVQDNYGIRLASASALPKSIVERSKVIASDLALSRKVIPEPSEAEVKKMNCVRLVRRLALIVRTGNIDLNSDDASEKGKVRAVVAKLKMLQDQFTVQDGEDSDTNEEDDSEVQEGMEQ